MASGGISPKGWTSVLTLLVVIAGSTTGGRNPDVAPGEPKASEPTSDHSNLTYLVEE
jgi:hypothetical protein